MVLVDAIARRLPGALAEGSGELESFSAELGGGLEHPHYTRPAEFRGWRVPDVLLSGDHGRDRALAEGACALRNPIDRLTAGLPHSLRVTIDWLVTILGAILIVLAIKQWIINPYRIPSSSMEPTLHCAHPGDRVSRRAASSAAPTGCSRAASATALEPEARRHRRLQHAAEGARAPAAPGGVYVKRLIGLPGRRLGTEKDGYVYINGKKLDEPYIKPADRDQSPTRRSRSRRGTTS